jgi:DNA-binding beta-propeller fold protein YncE
MPVLVVGVPKSEPLTIGCPDLSGAPQATWSGKTKLRHRFSWRGDVTPESEPAFAVSDADWLTLVEKFGLTPQLEDKAGSEGEGHRPTAALHGSVTTTPGRAPTLRRPRIKLWVVAIICFFAIPPFIWIPASMVMGRHQQHAEQLKADRERPFALPFTDLRVPHGVAVDTAGNVYVADTHTDRVLKLAAGSSTQTVLPFTGLDLCGDDIDESTAGVAVDAAGNVYVTDTCHNKVLKLAAGSSTQTVLPFLVGFPQGVAVDTAGTVYVADKDHYRVMKLAAGSTTPTALQSLGKHVSPHDLAMDGTGTVYASADVSCGKRLCSYLLKLAPGSEAWAKLESAGTQEYVAADTVGNVYVMTLGDNGTVMKLAPGSGNWTELPGEHRFVDPQGLAVDTRGNVYVTDHTGDRAQGTLFGIWKIGMDNARGFVLKLPTG